MKQGFKKILHRLGKNFCIHILKLMMYLTLFGVFAVGWRNGYARVLCGHFLSSASVAIMAIYAVLLYLLGRIYNAYEIGICRITEVVYSQILSELITGVAVYLLVSIIIARFADPIGFVSVFAVQIAVTVGWAWLANKAYFAIHRPKKTAVIYRTRSDLMKLGEIDRFHYNFKVVRTIRDPKCSVYELIRQLDGIEAMFVAGIDEKTRNGLAKYCVEKGIAGYMIPHIGDIIMTGAKYMQVFSVPVMRVEKAAPNAEYMLVKRLFDIAASLTGLIVLSPVMLVTAVLIKAHDGGPVFYRQTRLTKNGKRFRIMKFRSMRVNAESDGVARLSSRDDDRITPIGKWIRAVRIDELPQLWNILKGDMSIVGPRPERPEIAAMYERQMPEFRMRLQVKAGLTGMAQVYGRYNTEPYSKLEMDLLYIHRMSIPEDMRLMIATLKILFLKESTKGIENSAVTALYEERDQVQQ